MTDQILAQKKVVDGVPVLASFVGDLSPDVLRTMADNLKTRFADGLIVLGTNHEGKANFVVTVSPNWVDKGWHAGKLIKELAKEVGGSGGGRPDMAQAGGKEGAKVESVINTKVADVIKSFAASK